MRYLSITQTNKLGFPFQFLQKFEIFNLKLKIWENRLGMNNLLTFCYQILPNITLLILRLIWLKYFLYLLQIVKYIFHKIGAYIKAEIA